MSYSEQDRYRAQNREISRLHKEGLREEATSLKALPSLNVISDAGRCGRALFDLSTKRTSLRATKYTASLNRLY